MTNKEVINFLNQVRKIILDDKSWLESTIQPINEAFDMAINALTAETHDKRTEMHACDCVSRQAALDIERNATVDTNPSHFEAHQKFIQFMDDTEISSFGMWQWSNGFNTALTAVRIDLKKLPSAQPEIIRCGNCKHWTRTCGDEQWGLGDCDVFDKHLVMCNGYCAWAERREDGQK